MKQNVLVISGSAARRGAIARILQPAGYAVELAAGEKRARDLIASRKIDAAVVVAGDSGSDGFVRELHDVIGRVIELSVDRGNVDSQRLLASLDALLAPPANAEDVDGGAGAAEFLRFDGRTVDLAGHSFRDADGREVVLTRAEFRLLTTFLKRAGRVLSRDQLRAAVAGRGSESYDRSIDMLVARLRRKIEPDPKRPRFIVTAPGEGYKFAARPQRVQPDPVPATAPPGETREVSLVRLERRHMTVAACEFSGLDAFVATHDPEEMQAALSRVHAAIAEIVERFGGMAVRTPGPNLLAYFGYREAQEDDAERAVRAMLELLDAVPTIDAKLPGRPCLRAGIASGLVLAGDPLGPLQGHSAVGGPLNVALYLRSSAPFNAVLIDEGTRSLLGTFFNYEEVQPLAQRGSPPAPAWRVTGERGAIGRFEALHGAAMLDLVDREEHMEMLLRRWQTAQRGAGQAVVLTGEPGIGKSRVAVELEKRIGAGSQQCLHFFGVPHQNHAPMAAVIGELQRACGFVRADDPAARLRKLAALLEECGANGPEPLALLAHLLSLPAPIVPNVREFSPQRRKERTIAALLARLTATASRHPILVVIEDIHWIDPTSLEFFAAVVEHATALPMLVLGTMRPDCSLPWPRHAHVSVLELPRLGRSDAQLLLARVAGGKEIASGLINRIVASTEGVPLFIEELTKSMLESGDPPGCDSIDGAEGAYRGVRAIPTTLQGSLLARLDRLGSAREIAQVGAVIGREFSYELLHAVAPVAEQELQAALDRLSGSELVLRRGVPPLATYTFKHALVRDAAYAMLPKLRRRQLHGAVASALENGFPEILQAHPELLAHHHTEAGNGARAVAYLAVAAERALVSAAIDEARAHLNAALALLSHEPDGSARYQQELEIQVMLSRAWVTQRGHAAIEIRQALDRSRELCEKLGDQRRLPVVIYGQWGAAWAAAAYPSAIAHADEMLQWGRRQNDQAGITYGHFARGVCLMPMGALEEARTNLEAALALDHFDFQFGDLLTWGARVGGPTARLYLHHCLLLQGRLAQAEAVAASAMARIKEVSQPYARAVVLNVVCRMHALKRDVRNLLAIGSELHELSSAQGYPHFAATALVFRGWALALDGDAVEGSRLVRSGVDQCRDIGFRNWLSLHLAMLAECLAREGDVAAGLRTLAEADEMADRAGEHFWSAELERLRGEFLRRDGCDPQQAEACLVRAVDIARRQGARLLELRAATSLAGLRIDQGNPEQARDVLQPAHSGFAQDLGGEDLQDAAAVLARLR